MNEISKRKTKRKMEIMNMQLQQNWHSKNFKHPVFSTVFEVGVVFI